MGAISHTHEGRSSTVLSICDCYPAAVQLVDIGYFPCAPVRPTLAIDINLLEFVTLASHNMAPNVMGWSNTLQEFLSIRGYLFGAKVQGLFTPIGVSRLSPNWTFQDSIRRRFGSALHWYQVLVAMEMHEVDKWIRHATSTKPAAAPTMCAKESATREVPTRLQGALVEEIEDEDSINRSAPEYPPDRTLPYGRSNSLFQHSPYDQIGHGIASDGGSQSRTNTTGVPFPLPKDFHHINENVSHASSPSIYLQKRCPVCFSGGKPELQTSQCVVIFLSMRYQLTYHNRAQVVVCLDANFAQRRRHSRHPDPIDRHPDTHFLSEQDVSMMKQLVDHARPLESRTTSGRPQLPDETLDDCERTFVAAQGHIAKTSNAIFADTALMALLCRHDRPLFLVNITSAGERQYYALALIKALFLHLPSDWVVALLYDIACQLERSMRKVCLLLKRRYLRTELGLAWLFARVH